LYEEERIGRGGVHNPTGVLILGDKGEGKEERGGWDGSEG
jgi:hypothetical protein